jgi:hypothetical protein
MDTKRFSFDTTLTLIGAYLGLFVGLIDANTINLALPAIRDNQPRRRHLRGAADDRRLQHHLRSRTTDSRIPLRPVRQTHAAAPRLGDVHRRVAGLRGGPVVAVAACRPRRSGALARR